MDWTLAKIRKEVREFTKDFQSSDTELNARINDFYRERFPQEIDDKQLNGWYDKTIYPTDSCDYDVSDEILKIFGNEYDNPAFIDENEIKIFQDSAVFFWEYPRIDTGTAYCITSPTLAIGTDSTSKVANSAFTYDINGNRYSKAATETALEGDDIPEGTYGAWRLEIDEDGDISIVEAEDNATGYATAALAIQGLEAESSENACMGFVTAMSSSGVFSPGTTTLDDSDVTATYTDGFHSTRQRPDAALLEDDMLYIRPKTDEVRVFRCYAKQKPTELSSDTSTPAANEWGPFIAVGTSLEWAIKHQETEMIAGLSKLYEELKTLINRRYISQYFSGNQRGYPSF